MIVRELRKAIIEYLGRNPGEDVRLWSNKENCGIVHWNVSEKQPTTNELRKVWDSIKVREEQKVEQEKVNYIEKRYLSVTNQAFIDELETGVLMDAKIKTKRAEARAKII